MVIERLRACVRKKGKMIGVALLKVTPCDCINGAQDEEKGTKESSKIE